MARKKKGNKLHGWLSIDKPRGMTSTQVIGKVRRILQPHKIGHAGTLDPLATGVLPLALGEATKTVPYIQDSIKGYTFTVKWGEATNTDDAEGDVIATSDSRPTQAQIEGILSDFMGEIEQTPPQFSAVKIDGQRAYDLARKGQDVAVKSRLVWIEHFEVAQHAEDSSTTVFKVVCGKGTYVRSLGRDLAEKLGTKGHVITLHRDFVGGFDAQCAISLEKLEEMAQGALTDPAIGQSVLVPLIDVLDDIPGIAMTDQEAGRLRNGNQLKFVSRQDFGRLSHLQDGDEALAFVEDVPVAIVTVNKAMIQPVRVFNL